MNLAPASTADLHWSSVRTVPAPTSISGQDSATAAMLSRAAAVRKVISITSMPPARRALAVGTASPALSRTATGTMPAPARRFKISMLIAPFCCLTLTAD